MARAASAARFRCSWRAPELRWWRTTPQRLGRRSPAQPGGAGASRDRGAARRPDAGERGRGGCGANACFDRKSAVSRPLRRDRRAPTLRTAHGQALGLDDGLERACVLRSREPDELAVRRGLCDRSRVFGRRRARRPGLFGRGSFEGRAGSAGPPSGGGAGAARHSRQHPPPGSVRPGWAALPGKDERLADTVRRTPLGRTVSVDEIAQAAQFLCSRASNGIIGHTLVVDGGARIVD